MQVQTYQGRHYVLSNNRIIGDFTRKEDAEAIVTANQATPATPHPAVAILRRVLRHFEFICGQTDQGRLEHLQRWHQDHEPLRREAENAAA